MTPDQIVCILNNDGVTLQVVRGRISLTPKHAVKPRHRQLVEARKAEVLALLKRYPNATALGRFTLVEEDGRLHLAPGYEPPRPDELGRESYGRPRVITGRRRR